jgi:hypothetical protein
MEKIKLVKTPSMQLSKSIINVIVMILLTAFVYFGIDRYEVISVIIIVFSMLVTTIRLFPFMIKAVGDFTLVIFEHNEVKTLKPTLIKVVEFAICLYLANIMFQIALTRYGMII